MSQWIPPLKVHNYWDITKQFRLDYSDHTYELQKLNSISMSIFALNIRFTKTWDMPCSLKADQNHPSDIYFTKYI